MTLTWMPGRRARKPGGQLGGQLEPRRRAALPGPPADPAGPLAEPAGADPAVLASAVPSRRVLPETEQPVREVGQVLFGGLLGTGEVAGRYRAAAAVAAMRGEGLRVVLRIDTPALAGLPWEAMYDQAAGAYVCRQDQLVRHVPVASVPAPLRVTGPWNGLPRCCTSVGTTPACSPSRPPPTT